MSKNLTEKDHDDLDALVSGLLDDYKEGVITKAHAVATMGHIIEALDEGNYGEAVTWLREGRKLTRQYSK